MKTHYIVKESSAKMPSRCWGRYVRVAVIEVAAGLHDVSMISDRARGVVRIVETWEKCNVGRTERCAASRARTAARALAAELNAARACAEF